MLNVGVKVNKFKIAVGIAVATVSSLSQAQSEVTAKTLTDKLQHPWSMAFLPNGDMLITERDKGYIRRYSLKDGLSEPLKNVPEVVNDNQGGMLGITIDPHFSDNQTIYFCYSKAGDAGSSSSVARAKLTENAVSEVTTIFTANPLVDNGYHFGCRLAFDQDQKLLITLGDRYKFLNQAQNTDNHLGKIVRINRDGSVPNDNPFKNGAAPEIFSYGHRNVQGITIHPETHDIWAMEHGPRGGDEVNLIESGKNYGWPVITYGIDYSGATISDKTHQEGMEQPIIYWVPSIAPSGMTFYSGDKFPEWNGDLLVGSLKFRHLHRVTMNGNTPGEQFEYLKDVNERVRDVGVGPDGLIYVLTDEQEGKLIQVSPK